MSGLQRMREVFREGWRNLVSGTTRPLLALIAFAIVVGAVGVAQARGLVGVAQDALQWQRQGSAVQIITSEGQIDGRVCDALSGIPGIQASGAVRSATAVRIAVLPSVPINYFEVTGGLPELLGVVAAPGQEPGGVWLPEDLARVVGTTATHLPMVEDRADVPGRWVYAGNPPISGVFNSPAGGQSSPLDYSVLAQVPSTIDNFDSCWALLWPESSHALSLLHYAAIPVPDEGMFQPPRLSQLNTTAGTSFNAAGRIGALPTFEFTVAAVAFSAVLGFALINFRRLELASALHAGVRKPSLLIQIVVETLGWLIPASVAAIAASYVAARRGNPDPFWVAFYPSLRTVLIALIAALIASVLAAAIVRERRLFRHFKQR